MLSDFVASADGRPIINVDVDVRTNFSRGAEPSLHEIFRQHPKKLLC